MTDQEWFEGDSLDRMERCYWRRIGFLIFAALALAVIFLPLMGCATKISDGRTEVCFLQPLGQTEEGYTVVASHCMTPEAFKASQR